MEGIEIKKLNRRKFRRQHSIGNYIVDFFCVSEKLVIELDGNSTNQPPRPESEYVSELNCGPATPPSKGGETYRFIFNILHSG
jgi:very-short-patch-repair endonuclease